MERQTIDITERSFSPELAKNCKLVLLVGDTGINATVVQGNSILALRGWHLATQSGQKLNLVQALHDLNTVFATEPLFDYSYAEIAVFLVNHWATLVPDRLFSSTTEAKKYLHLLTLPENDLQCSSVPLSSYNSHLVYGVEREIVALLKAKFPKAMFSHTAHGLLLSWQKMVTGKTPQVFLNVNNGIAQIAVFDRGSLQFFNSFAYNEPSDFIYFVLLPFSEMKLDPLQIPIMVSGEIIAFSTLHKILMRYTRIIHFTKPRTDLDIPGSIQALPDHFNYDLFAML